MPRFHFHIQENSRFHPDEEGQEFVRDGEEVRKEAMATGASIARDLFMSGNGHRVVVDVREEDAPFLKISITLDVEGPGEGRSTAPSRVPRNANNRPALRSNLI